MAISAGAASRAMNANGNVKTGIILLQEAVWEVSKCRRRRYAPLPCQQKHHRSSIIPLRSCSTLNQTDQELDTKPQRAPQVRRGCSELSSLCVPAAPSAVGSLVPRSYGLI